MPVKRKPDAVASASFDSGTLRSITTGFGLPDADRAFPLLLDGDTPTLLEARSKTIRKALIPSGNDLIFIKEIPWYANDEDLIGYSHASQVALRERGLRLAALYRTLTGTTWLTLGNKRFTATEYIPGRRYCGHSMQASSVGQYLASMHAIGIDLKRASTEDVFTLARDHVSLLADLRPELSSTVVPALLARLEACTLKALEAGWRSLPSYFVHGDCNPWNFIFDEHDGVASIVDFDNCDFQSRLHDLAEAVVTFSALEYLADSTSFARIQPKQLNTEASLAFLSAYNSTFALTDSELACLPYAITAVYIELFSLGLIRGDFGIDQVADILSLADTVPKRSKWTEPDALMLSVKRSSASNVPQSISVKRALPNIVLVIGGKGGVGKSTIACNLAIRSGRRGQNVGLLDADFTCPSTHLILGCNERPRVRGSHLLPNTCYGVKLISTGTILREADSILWHGPLLRGLLHQFLFCTDWGSSTQLFVDVPPGTSEVLIAILDLIPTASCVAVSSPAKLSQVDTTRALNAIVGYHSSALVWVNNMVDEGLTPDAALMHGSSRQKFEHYVQIPHLASMSVATDCGRPLTLEKSVEASVLNERLDLILSYLHCPLRGES